MDYISFDKLRLSDFSYLIENERTHKLRVKCILTILGKEFPNITFTSYEDINRNQIIQYLINDQWFKYSISNNLFLHCDKLYIIISNLLLKIKMELTFD